jgi:DNA polymerase I-like protein with 3'-5' exonuclease and polymerase domains
MLVALDIETSCAVQSCPGFGISSKCDHGLDPWKSKIDVIGVIGEEIEATFTLDQFLIFHDSWQDSIQYIGHNFKFDMLHLVRHGCNIKLDHWVGDTMLMAYVCTDKIPDAWLANYEWDRAQQKGKHRKGSKHSLKTLAPFFLGVDPFWESEDKNDKEYVLKDTRYTWELYEVLTDRLKELGQFDFYEKKLLPWTKMLLTAEVRGICIDMKALDEKERELKAKVLDLEERLDIEWEDAHLDYHNTLMDKVFDKYKAMADKAGKPLETGSRYGKLLEAAVRKLPTKINYGSPAQMKWLLRDYLGYDVQSLEGDESTGKEVLNRLADEGKEDIKLFLEWRKCNKLLEAFIPTYRDLQVDGVVHPVFNPCNTRTGRTSSERPNMQQVPPELRPLFIPRPGYKFVGYDAAAIEARLIGLYSDDPTLYKIISDGISIHDHNTKVFFGYDTPYEAVSKVHKQERAASKNVGFALFYNAGANRIRIAFAQKGYHLTENECQQLLNRFRSSYQTAMQYSKNIVSYLEGGEVLENLMGRPIRIENAEDCYMQGFNTLIQSSASDYNLDAGYKAWKAAQELGMDAWPLLFVHDFNCFEVRDEQTDAFNHIYPDIATDYVLTTSHGPLPLAVEGGIMTRWEK